MQCQEIFHKGRAINPLIIPMPDAPKKQTKVKKTLDRLENHKKWMLTFFHDFQIPFANNLAEQDVRTFEGVELFATICSYI